MKIYTSITTSIETGAILSEEFFEYEGPLELCDRSAAKQARTAGQTASAVGAQQGANASQVGGNLIPGLEREAQGGQGYTPTEMSHQLVASEEGAGGATSGITGTANLEAERTRNAAGYGAALDEAQREKGRMLSKNALDVANKSSDLGEKKQQFAQGELSNIYGMDTKAMLEAMGLVPKDLEAAAANNTNWTQGFENVMKGLSAGVSGYNGAKNG